MQVLFGLLALLGLIPLHGLLILLRVLGLLALHGLLEPRALHGC